MLLIVLVCSFYIFSLWLKNVAMWKKENALKIFISSFAFLTRSVYFLGKLLPLLKKILFSPNVRFFKDFFIQKSFGEKILNISWGKNHLKKKRTKSFRNTTHNNKMKHLMLCTIFVKYIYPIKTTFDFNFDLYQALKQHHGWIHNPLIVSIPPASVPSQIFTFAKQKGTVKTATGFLRSPGLF